MTTTEFLTEALARAAEHEQDYDDSDGIVWGVVWFDDNGPRTIDIYRGDAHLVRTAAQYMVTHQGLSYFMTHCFGRLTENRSKSELIRETALLVTG